MARALEPLYVFVGAESELVEGRLQSLLAELPDDTSVQTFHGAAVDGGQIALTLRTVSMFASYEVVVIKHVELLRPEQISQLEAAFEPIPTAATLILAGEKLDGRGQLAKLAKDRGTFLEMGAAKAAGVSSFVDEQLNKLGLKMNRAAKDALMEHVGQDLALLRDSLDRLKLYVGERKVIEAIDVDQAIAPSRTESIWKLVDEVTARRTGAALIAVRSLLEDREPPIRILAMIVRQFRLLTRMRVELDDGKKPAEAASSVGIPPFKAMEMAKAAKSLPATAYAQAFGYLLEADVATKSSRVPPHLILEQVVLRLCALDTLRS